MNNTIPPVVKNLLILNGLMFLGTYVAKNFDIDLIRLLGIFPLDSKYFQPYQFVTHMFMHGGFLHIFSNMFALWMFGSKLEQVWGSSRFLFFYFFTGLGAAALHLGVSMYEVSSLKSAIIESGANISSIVNASSYQIESLAQNLSYKYGLGYDTIINYWYSINTPTVGASGAVFGVLIGFGMLFPNTRLMLLFPPIPMKAKVFVFLYGAFELYAGFSTMHGGSNIAHFAHVGGMLFGYILIKYWQKKGQNFY